MSSATVRVLILALLLAAVFFHLGSVWQRRVFFAALETAASARLVDGFLSNTFVNLAPRKIEAGKELSLEGSAGGIYAQGNDVIGVTGPGEFFLYRSGQEQRRSLRKLEVQLDNNIEVFIRFAKIKELDVPKVLEQFRFIDLIIVENETGNSLIVSHHYWHDHEKCFTLRASMLRLPSGDLAAVSARTGDWSTLYETRPCLRIKDTGERFAGHEHGGRLALDAEGRLLLTVGDFNFDGVSAPEILAQDEDADYGKVLRIDLRTGARETVSIGHRNPQGLMIDRDGNVWATEHGPKGGDELNLIREGANYGWPFAVYGAQYRTTEWPLARNQGRHDGFAPPVWAWLPSVGVSNLIQVRGFAPSWDGDFLIATLSGSALYRMRYQDGGIVFAEPIPVGDRIRDIDQLEDGTIVLWTDRAELIELRNDGSRASPSLAAQEAVLAALDAPLRSKVENAIESCAMCHSTDPAGASGTAPNLWGVYGRRIASTPFLKYSAALRGKKGAWTEEELSRFLADGEAYAPGNAMAVAPIADPEVRRKLVDYLKKLQ